MLVDAVLVLHVAIAVFVTLGLPAVWIGWGLDWQWVRNPWFRYGHLVAIAIVAAEAVAGITCPLTILEDALRGMHEPRSFIGRWMARILFYEAPNWVFTVIYISFAVATLISLTAVRPRPWSRAMIRP